MPEVKLAVNDDRAEEIEALIAMSEPDLAALQELITKPSPNPVPYGDKIDSPEVRAVVSLRRFIDRRQADPNDVVNGLEEGLRRYGWNDEKIAKFRKLKSTLASILRSEKLSLAQKVLSEYYDILFHAHNIKISTELKPIFSNDDAGIETFVLYNVLKLTYSDGYENEQELNVTLDIEDLAKLQQACEQALKRTQTARQRLREKSNANIIVYSERAFEAEQGE